MADQGRWFKLWAGALSDPDLSNLSLEDFGRWAKFGVYLKVHGTDGALRLAPPSRALQALLDLPSFEAVTTRLALFPNCEIRRDDANDEAHDSVVTVRWLNWRKYQVDSSAERQRRYRHRQAFGVTTKKRGDEKRRDEKRREEKRTNPKTPPIVPPEGDAFDRFWEAYPKRIGKDAARKAWTNPRPTAAHTAESLAAVERQRAYLTREGGRYCPNPATWLTQGRWQDRPPEPSGPTLTPRTQGNLEVLRRFAEKGEADAGD